MENETEEKREICRTRNEEEINKQSKISRILDRKATNGKEGKNSRRFSLLIKLSLRNTHTKERRTSSEIVDIC